MVSLRDNVKAISFNNIRAEDNQEERDKGILNKAEVIWENGSVTAAYDMVFSYNEYV